MNGDGWWLVVMRFNLESPCNVASFEVLRCKNVPDDGSAARAGYGFGGDEQQQREQQLAKVRIKRTAPPIDKASCDSCRWFYHRRISLSNTRHTIHIIQKIVLVPLPHSIAQTST